MGKDLQLYETLGDLDEPFETSKANDRRQQQCERNREAVTCGVPMLTLEQYRAGLPCPGCGRPYLDAEPFDFRGTANFTDAERVRYDAEEAAFRDLHGECHGVRHSVSGSLTKHCGKCCPPPPMSPERLSRIAKIVSHPTPPDELMSWRLRLYCGHVVERQSHATNKTVHAAFTGSVRWNECGLDPATIVDARTLGRLVEPKKAPHVPVAAPRKPTRAQLEKHVAELEAEVLRLTEASDDTSGDR